MAQALEDAFVGVPNLVPEAEGGFAGAGSWADDFRQPASYVGLWGEGGCVALSNVTSMLDSGCTEPVRTRSGTSNRSLMIGGSPGR